MLQTRPFKRTRDKQRLIQKNRTQLYQSTSVRGLTWRGKTGVRSAIRDTTD